MFARRRNPGIPARRRAPLRRAFSWILRLLLLALLIDLAYLYVIWPDWSEYRAGALRPSRFIEDYRRLQANRPEWPQLRWSPVALERIPRHVLSAVIVAEDARFYQHKGIDFDALKEAMQTNLAQKRLAYGASTISQQTVKNLFLSRSRNPLRKWHELVLTFAMERNLSKRRIIEYYLNVAEFGRGIYGVDAAARYYWDLPVTRISRREAIELAATLPAPVGNNPRLRTRAFERRVRKIERYFSR